jgi:hypothetical protein
MSAHSKKMYGDKGSACLQPLCTLKNSASNDQTGFIPGRYIGENCRLIYDILHFTEENDIPGILLLIDFEKAFDSISWSFIYDTLK